MTAAQTAALYLAEIRAVSHGWSVVRRGAHSVTLSAASVTIAYNARLGRWTVELDGE